MLFIKGNRLFAPGIPRVYLPKILFVANWFRAERTEKLHEVEMR